MDAKELKAIKSFYDFWEKNPKKGFAFIIVAALVLFSWLWISANSDNKPRTEINVRGNRNNNSGTNNGIQVQNN